MESDDFAGPHGHFVVEDDRDRSAVVGVVQKEQGSPLWLVLDPFERVSAHGDDTVTAVGSEKSMPLRCAPRPLELEFAAVLGLAEPTASYLEATLPHLLVTQPDTRQALRFDFGDRTCITDQQAVSPEYGIARQLERGRAILGGRSGPSKRQGRNDQDDGG
jgi:hypothetical protein